MYATHLKVHVIVFVAVAVLLLAPQHSEAISCAGCVDLDELNFDATIRRFPYAIVKFDIAFPYGEKHEAFAAFSRAAHLVSDDLLIGTVGIKDYGELENKALGERFKVDDKNFPTILLYKGSVDGYVKFPAHLDVTLDNLKSFVTENTELYIGRDGCLKEFNDLAKVYANQDDEIQQMLIKKAKELAKAYTNKPEADASARNYVLFMRKINEKGYGFVEDETKRLLRLRAGKVSDVKKVELSRKLNVLEAFRVTRLTKAEREDKVKEEAKEDL